MSDLGTISVSPCEAVRAGSLVTLTFTYRVGKAGLREGGSIRIRLPGDGWDLPKAPVHRQFERSRLRTGKDGGYVGYADVNTTCSWTTRSEAWVDLAGEQLGPRSRFIVAVVRDGDLREGDTIEIIYGDALAGGKRVRVQRVAPTPEDDFRCYVDGNGDGEFEELPNDGLRFPVLPGPPSRLRLTAPAMVCTGEPFPLRLAVTDPYGNVAAEHRTGEIRLAAGRAGAEMPGALELKQEHGNHRRIESVRLNKEGVYRLSAEPADGGKVGASNPIWCTDSPCGLYFGDLHCHSLWHMASSLGTPEECWRYGRDLAHLDFMALTDSGMYRQEARWKTTQELANAFNEPGRFVAFRGYEFGYAFGHRNVIFKGDAIEPALTHLPPRTKRGSLAALYETYRGRDDVLLIPHHPKAWMDWDEFDQELEPIVEGYSCWGSSVVPDDPLWDKCEKPGGGVYSALQRGYRLGMIGSGDSHSGMPGRSFPECRGWCTGRKSGYACVWAEELTREAIFNALRRRRCYATTGVRAILEFHVNEAFMGESLRLPAPDRPRRLAIHAIGTERFERLTIFKNNRVLEQRDLQDDEVFHQYTDRSPAQHGDFYFVRLEQDDEDRNTIWSSPVWMDVDGAKGA